MRRGRDWARIVARLVLGALFLAAAAGKAASFGDFTLLVGEIGRTLEQPWLADRGGLVAGTFIGVEAVIGALLVAGLAPGLAPLSAMVFLTFVTVVEARLWRTGAWSQPCHCGLPWLDLSDHRAIVVRNAVLAALAWTTYVLRPRRRQSS